MSWFFPSSSAYFSWWRGRLIFLQSAYPWNGSRELDCSSSLEGSLRKLLSDYLRVIKLVSLLHSLSSTVCWIICSLVEGELVLVVPGTFLTAFATFILFVFSLRSFCLACGFYVPSLIWIFKLSVLNLNTFQFHEKLGLSLCCGDTLVWHLCSSASYVLCWCTSHMSLQYCNIF